MTHYVLPEANALIRYDKEVRGLYIAIGNTRSSAHTVTANESPLVNLDYDDKDKLIGVEILLPKNTPPGIDGTNHDGGTA